MGGAFAAEPARAKRQRFIGAGTIPGTSRFAPAPFRYLLTGGSVMVHRPFPRRNRFHVAFARGSPNKFAKGLRALDIQEVKRK